MRIIFVMISYNYNILFLTDLFCQQVEIDNPDLDSANIEAWSAPYQVQMICVKVRSVDTSDYIM